MVSLTATYYSTGLGACGVTNTDTDYIAAVSHTLFDNYPGYTSGNPNSNPICNKKVTANCKSRPLLPRCATLTVPRRQRQHRHRRDHRPLRGLLDVGPRLLALRLHAARGRVRRPPQRRDVEVQLSVAPRYLFPALRYTTHPALGARTPPDRARTPPPSGLGGAGD